MRAPNELASAVGGRMPSAVIIIHVASRDRRRERRRNAELVSKQALLERCFSSVTVAASAILPELL